MKIYFFYFNKMQNKTTEKVINECIENIIYVIIDCLGYVDEIYVEDVPSLTKRIRPVVEDLVSVKSETYKGILEYKNK